MKFYSFILHVVVNIFGLRAVGVNYTNETLISGALSETLSPMTQRMKWLHLSRVKEKDLSVWAGRYWVSTWPKFPTNNEMIV